MRRASVADELRKAERLRVSSLSPGERVLLALSLGRQSLDVLRSNRGLSLEQARRLRERQLQARRRPSPCLEALLH